MYLAFAAAIALALGIVIAKKLQASWAYRRRIAAPGFSLEEPLQVESYAELDDRHRALRCPRCGKGRLFQLGEGPVRGTGGQTMAIRTECSRCEERVAIYVDVGSIPN